MKTCTQCNNAFQIFGEDLAFYKKIDVPEPTWCPDCRNKRRCARRNERVLYMRACDLCKKNTLSTHHTDVPFFVYCQSCWWSDRWDPLSHGREFNFSRPFFEQFDELSRSVPHIALNVKEMENSDYCQYAERLKNSYLSIGSSLSENLFYTYWVGWSKDIVDCNFVLHSERCFECQDVQKSYDCRFVYSSQNMTDSAFCFACNDCASCFMCVNLNHKSYCIKNVQYTKGEYERAVLMYNFGSYQMVEMIKNEFRKFVSSQPRKYAFLSKTEDSVGDYLNECSDVYRGFDVFRQERGRYVYDAGMAKDCMDLLNFGVGCELDYECHYGGRRSYNTHFADSIDCAMNCEYVMNVRDIQDCFGCFGLQKKQYCVFNIQYSREEYATLRARIIEHMKKTGEYGEFFPIQYSPYAYNETVAQQWYPKTKEEVLASGWKWRDVLPGRYDTPTIEWASTPDDISDMRESIIKNIFACQKCAKNYRIVKQEFGYYAKWKIPLPRQCPNCRFSDRFSRRNPRKLWHRQCMCEKGDHEHAGRCPIAFETSYSPERSELVYCEVCYQKEVV